MNKAINKTGQFREWPLALGLLVVGGWIMLVVGVGLAMAVRLLVELWV